MYAKYDIFRKLPDGHPVWMKAVEGLEEAKYELAQLADRIPGDYFIYDTRNGSVINAEKSAFFSLSPSLSVDLSE